MTVRLEQATLSRADLEKEKRTPWFCLLDEFQKFVANEGSARVIAEILSEVRKFGLRLGLAHQGWHQIENERLAGALDQAQVKVVFGSGTRTGRVIAEELFAPDPEKVKHEVEDPAAQGRSHPLYESLLEQKERFIQAIRRQKRRQVFVLPPESEGDEVIALRTLTVPSPKVSRQRLEALKLELLKKHGRPKRELENQINNRDPRQESSATNGEATPGKFWVSRDHSVG